MKLTEELRRVLDGRFGKDSLIALATTDGLVPSVRTVDGLYFDSAFYVITYALSNKMRQISANSAVAVSGDWFTAHGVGENLGYALATENAAIFARLKTAFAAWIDNGHNNFDDPNTCILRIRLTDGVLFDSGARYVIEF